MCLSVKCSIGNSFTEKKGKCLIGKWKISNQKMESNPEKNAKFPIGKWKNVQLEIAQL